MSSLLIINLLFDSILVVSHIIGCLPSDGAWPIKVKLILDQSRMTSCVGSRLADVSINTVTPPPGRTTAALESDKAILYVSREGGMPAHRLTSLRVSHAPG